MTISPDQTGEPEPDEGTAIFTATVVVEYDPETQTPEEALADYAASTDILAAFTRQDDA
jgi:hypothetical protein